jgi:Ca-activated chloride channel homolog
MGTTLNRTVALTAGVVLSAALAGSYELAAQSSIYRSGVEVVTLTVTVTDRAGRYVPDLTASDFAIFEDGKPQTVSQFASGHVPVDVGFLLDTSSSMRENLPLAQKAACGLARQLRQGDRGAVAGIASTVLLHQSMTLDLTRVDAALRSTHANGNTALYDSLYVLLRQFQQQREASSEVRRQVVVLLSDGIDTASHVTFDDVLELLRRVEVTIYVVSLTDPVLVKGLLNDRTVSESTYALSTVARESGGRLFTPRSARELPEIYDAIGQELSNQYVLGYVPTARGSDGILRHVSVGVLQPRIGMARTRAGYYADSLRVGDTGFGYARQTAR